MPRNAFVPMSWIVSELNGEALRTLILISTHANGETGKCNVRNNRLASMLGKTDRSVRNDIAEIVKAGFISIENGNSRERILTIESPEWFHRPGRKTSGLERANPEEKLPGQPGRKTSAHPEEKLPGNPEEKLPGPIMNTILEHNSQHNGGDRGVAQESKPDRKSPAAAAGNLEPFESGLAAELPAVRNGYQRPAKSRIEIVPTQFRTEQRQRMAEVLGIESDEFARLVSQEMADSGFLEWVLKRAETAKKPIALAVTLLKRAWRDNWTNPEAAEDAQYAELVEFMRDFQ